MSYLIKIGQPVIVEYEGVYLLDIEETTSKGAPIFAHDCTEQVNERGCATLAWEQFSRKAGLLDFWYSEPRNLMEDGQISRIYPSDLDRIREAIRDRKAENPEGIPGFCGCSTCDPIKKNPHPHRKEMDTTLARLLWLEYWMDWALKNCSMPSFRCW